MAVPWLQIAAVGLPLLQKLGESRDVGRYKKQLEQQQKTANLIGALSKGRVQYEPTAEYKPSAFTQLAGAASTGLGAYNTFRDLTAKRAAQGVAQQLSEAELAKLQREASKERGAADYAQGIGRQVEEAKRLAPGGAGPSLGQFPTFGGEAQENVPLDQRGGATPAPSILEQMGRLDPFRVMGQQQAARTASQQAAEDRAAEFERETERISARANMLRAQRTGMPTATSILAQQKNAFDKVSGIMKSRGSRGLSFDKSIEGLDLRDLTSADRVLLQEHHTQALYERSKNINSEVADFLWGKTRQKFSQDQFLKKSGDLKFGINLLTKGFNLQDGVGDIMMVNASVRLADPGVSVRPAEAETMEEAMALLEKYELIATGEKVLDGDRFTPAFRNRLLNGGLANYEGSQSLVKKQLEVETAAMLPQVMSIIDAEPGVTGKDAARELITPFLETYQLFPVETYKYDTKAYERGQKQTPQITPEGDLWEQTKSFFEF